MARIQWQPAFETGISEVDDQHKKLVGLINQLEDQLTSGSSVDNQVVGRVFTELINYTEYHFAFEQKLQQDISFSGQAEHLARHSEFIFWLDRNLVTPNLDSTPTVVELLEYLMDWFLKHILVEDMKFAREYTRLYADGDGYSVDSSATLSG